MIDKEKCSMDADDLMMLVLDAGAEDFSEEDGIYEIITDPDAFDGVCEALGSNDITPESAEVTRIPQTTVKLTSEEDIKNMEKILDMLDEDDDVQNVFHNWEDEE